jgi:hypothetical protein
MHTSFSNILLVCTMYFLCLPARFYKYAMVDVFAHQKALQDDVVIAVKQLEAGLQQRFSGSLDSGEVVKALTDFTAEQAKLITDSWRQLFYHILTKYVIYLVFCHFFHVSCSRLSWLSC